MSTSEAFKHHAFLRQIAHHGRPIGRSPEGQHWFFVLDGKVFRSTGHGSLVGMGDYFEFMADVREGRFSDWVDIGGWDDNTKHLLEVYGPEALGLPIQEGGAT